MLLTEKVKIYEASRSLAGDIFQADEFVMLCGVVAELEPKQIDCFVNVAVADYYVFIVYRFRAAGKHSVAVAVSAILHNYILIFAVFGKRGGIFSLAALQHYRVVVDVYIAVFYQHVTADVDIDSVGAWRQYRRVGSEDIAIQIFDAVAFVDMGRPEVRIPERCVGYSYVVGI